jgi:hypothetical protein
MVISSRFKGILTAIEPSHIVVCTDILSTSVLRDAQARLQACTEWAPQQDAGGAAGRDRLCGGAKRFFRGIG